jgi:hypothetical protein
LKDLLFQTKFAQSKKGVGPKRDACSETLAMGVVRLFEDEAFKTDFSQGKRCCQPAETAADNESAESAHYLSTVATASTAKPASMDARPSTGIVRTGEAEGRSLRARSATAPESG